MPISGSSTLEIVGATTLGSTLAVSGTATLAGTTNAQALTATTLSASSTLEIVGATVLGNTLAVSGNVTLGDAAADVTTVTGQLTASHGAYFADRVGIGTSTPGTILEIGDGSTVDTITINSLQGSNDTLMSTILFENNTDSVAMINAFRGSSAGAGELRFGTQKSAGVAYQMTIDEDGNVGIGTTTPDKTLTVDGTFGCSGSVTLGDAAADVTTVTGQLTASVGAQFTGAPIGIGLAATNNAGGRGPANPQNLVTIYGDNTISNGGGLTIDSTGSIAGSTNAGLAVFANEGTGYFIMGVGGGEDNIWSDLARGDMFYRQTADKRQMWGNRDEYGWDMCLSGSFLGIGANIGATADLTHRLQVNGTISGSSTLEVVGATVLGSTLAVSGTATLAGTTNAQALTATTISASSTLQAAGATVLGSTLAVTGNVTMAGTSINDASGNELIGLNAAGSAINYARISNAAAGSGPSISATGDDDHVSLSLGVKGNQSSLIVSNDASVGALLMLNDGQSGGSLKQIGFKAPNTADNSYYMTLPVSGAATYTGRDQFLKVTSISDTGGPTNVVTSFENVQATYEPTGILFEYLSATKIQISSSTSLDHVGRIPISNGSNTRVAELTGTLSFDFALGPGAGVGGLQRGSIEAVSAGYEIRYISGSSGHGLLGTSETSSYLDLPSGYTYSSDILWFIYNKSDANIANFMDTGRVCTYGGWGPGTLDAGNGNSYNAGNLLVDDANKDEWTEFSFDSQVPVNARYIDTGAFFENAGCSLLHFALSGTYDNLYYYGNLLFKMGSQDTSDTRDLTTQAFFNPSTPALTGTIMYRFQNRTDANQDGYIWVRGWRF